MNKQQVGTDIAAAIEYLQGLDAVTNPGLGVIGFSLGAYHALGLSIGRPDVIHAVIRMRSLVLEYIKHDARNLAGGGNNRLGRAVLGAHAAKEGSQLCLGTADGLGRQAELARGAHISWAGRNDTRRNELDHIILTVHHPDWAHVLGGSMVQIND